MSSDSTTIGRRIRELRRQRGISAQSIAGATGLARSSVARIEAGKANPNLDSLARIAATLGVPTSSLFEGSVEERRLGATEASPAPAPTGGRATQALREERFSVPRQSEVALMNVEHGTRAMWTEPGLYWRLELPPAGPPVSPPQEVIVCVAGRQVGEDPYDLVEHPQDEFLVVLDGAFDVTVGTRTFRLQEGDAIHLSGSKPHQYELVGDEPARLLQVVLPQASRGGSDAPGHA